MARPRPDWRRHVVRRPDAPDTWDPPSPTAALGLFLATRALPEGPPRAFRDTDRVFEALARGDLALDAAVRVEGRVTTAGRCLVDACLPPSVREPTRGVPWTRAYATEVLARITRELHVELAARAAEALERLGGFVAERSGLSLCAGHFAPPPARDAVVADTLRDVLAVQRLYDDAQITDGERRSKLVDLWAAAAADLRRAAQLLAPSDDPIAAFAAALSDATLPTRLRVMAGPRASRHGEVHELPIRRTPGEGYAPHEWTLLATQARAESLAREDRDAVAAALLHDLHAVLWDVRVVARDCATRGSVRLWRDAYAEEEGAPTLGARAEGHVLAEDVTARDGSALARAGTLLTPPLARAVDAARVTALRVCDLRRCEAAGGVCATCLGRDPDDATLPAPGDPVGARAALAIARAARGFHRVVFHICGAAGVVPFDASRDGAQTLHGGVVRYVGLAWISVAEDGASARVCLAGGKLEVRQGAFVMESFAVRASDTLCAEDGEAVAPGAVLVRRPRWGDRVLRAALPEGVTATARWSEEASDEVVDMRTGLSRFAFAPGEDDVALNLIDAEGRTRATHLLPRRAWPRVASGALVRRGDALAMIWGEPARFDLPRGAEWLRDLFDARAPEPSYAAVIAPCDGRIEALEPRRVTLRADDGRDVSVRRRPSQHMIVREGDFVRAGDPLVDGARSHHRLLRFWGADRLADHMLDELAQEASLQTARVAGAWWSLAVRAMLAWRRVVRPGDTGLPRNTVIARDAFERVQREAAARGGEPARAVPVLRGFAAMARDQLRGGA